jgi:purine-binding chemotaxis protein CheW
VTDLFLVAHLAGRAVAIASSQVESVVDIGEIVPVPRSGRQVRGLAALRSRVVTVIDSRVALGLEAEIETGSRAIITVVEGHHYAILVDSLEDVAPFEMAPLSSGVVLDGGWRQVGCGIVERAGEPVLAIDLRALIPGMAIAA